MALEGELTLTGEYTMWNIDDILQNCALGACVTLLTIVMPINFNLKM